MRILGSNEVRPEVQQHVGRRSKANPILSASVRTHKTLFSACFIRFFELKCSGHANLEQLLMRIEMDLSYLKESLKYEAAKMCFDKLDVKVVKAHFDSLMNQGIWLDEFVDIEYPTTNTQVDFKPAFEAALKALDIKAPSDKEEATWLILRKNISDIALEYIDPLDGLQRLITDIYWDYDFGTITKHYLGDSHGIEHLIGWYWGYDDMKERPTDISCNEKYGEEAIIELKKEVIKSAKAWVQEYGDE